MKKMYLVLIASVMAVGLSSFTNTKKPTVYFKYNGSFDVYSDSPCPNNGGEICEKPHPSIPLATVTLYTTNVDLPANIIRWH